MTMSERRNIQNPKETITPLEAGPPSPCPGASRSAPSERLLCPTRLGSTGEKFDIALTVKALPPAPTSAAGGSRDRAAPPRLPEFPLHSCFATQMRQMPH